MSDPPRPRAIVFQRSFPFVTIERREETPADHTTMFLITGAFAVAFAASPLLPTIGAVPLAWISGFAVAMRFHFQDIYEGPGGDA